MKGVAVCEGFRTRNDVSKKDQDLLSCSELGGCLRSVTYALGSNVHAVSLITYSSLLLQILRFRDSCFECDVGMQHNEEAVLL
jgi:hypothetical protein